MILYSIIIPHYNSVEYLEELIAGIPAAEEIQLIVVDDKSEENTEKAEALVLKRGGIFLHNTTSKKGAGTCRNLGLQKATGKWLLFADADDYYLKDAFAILDAYKDSDADIVYFAPTSRYRGTKEPAKRHRNYEALVLNYQKEATKENEISLRYKFVSPCSKMIRNEMVQEGGILFDEVPASNDVMFSLKCAYQAQKVEAAHGQIYCIISAEGTLTTKYNEVNFWSRVKVYKERYFFLKERLNKEEQRAFGASTFCGMTMIYKALKQGYGLKTAMRIWSFFRENQVKIIDFDSLKVSLYRKLLRKNIQ